MKNLSAKTDFLGIVALGSLIGNLAQTNKINANRAQYGRLAAMYNHLVTQYKALYRDYMALRQVNEQLLSDVASLRAKNSHLLNQIAVRGPAK